MWAKPRWKILKDKKVTKNRHENVTKNRHEKSSRKKNRHKKKSSRKKNTCFEKWWILKQYRHIVTKTRHENRHGGEDGGGVVTKFWINFPRDIFGREDLNKKVLECVSTYCRQNPDQKYSKTKKLRKIVTRNSYKTLNNFSRRHCCQRRHRQKSLRMCFYVLWKKPRWKILKDQKVTKNRH